MAGYTESVGDIFTTTKDGDLVVKEVLGDRKVLVKFLDSGNEYIINSYNLYTKKSKQGFVMVADKAGRQARVLKESIEKAKKKDAIKRHKMLLNKVKFKNQKILQKREIEEALKPTLDKIYAIRSIVKSQFKDWKEVLQKRHEVYLREYKRHVKSNIGYVTKTTINDVLDEEGNPLKALFSTLTLSGRLWTSLESRTTKRTDGYYKSYAGKENKFQNYYTFANWCFDQEFYGKDGYELDKDILGADGNYDENSCTFIPNSLNVSYAHYMRYGLTSKIKESFLWHITNKTVPDKVLNKLILIIG